MFLGKIHNVRVFCPRPPLISLPKVHLFLVTLCFHWKCVKLFATKLDLCVLVEGESALHALSGAEVGNSTGVNGT